MSIVTNDFRDVARPQGGAYDIGAFEGTGGVPTPPVIPPVNPPYTPPPVSGTPIIRPSGAIALIPCTSQTIVSSPGRASGCNEGGVGWVPFYSYGSASGSVPVGANPVDGETLTGKRTIHLYAQMTHYNYL